MNWIVETLNASVDEELNALPHHMRARLARIAFMIESIGLEKVREPHIKHLEGVLWEIRMIGKEGIARAIYVTAPKQRVIIVRAFVKKTQKTPRREIDLALRRTAEILP